MSDDLVSRLRDAHANSMQRIVGSNIFNDAATALTEARAEIERLRAERDCYLDNWKEARAYLAIETSHAAQAESELSTLRARVREVVEPFVSHYAPWMDEHDPETESSTFPRHTFAQLNAARQLMEEVK